MTQTFTTNDQVLYDAGRWLEVAMESLRGNTTAPAIEMLSLSSVADTVRTFLRSVQTAGNALVDAASTGILTLSVIKTEGDALDERIGMAIGTHLAARRGIDTE